MSYEDNKESVSFPAAGDLSADQFKFVKVNSAGRVALVGTLGTISEGVLQNAPNAIDRVAEVAIGGIVRVKCAAAITIGANVSSTALGLATTALTTHEVLGTALETGAAGNVIAMLFQPRGRAL